MSYSWLNIAIGAAVFPAIFNPIVKSIGFGWAVRVMAFITLACLLGSIVLLKQRVLPDKPRKPLDLTAFREARFNIFNTASLILFMGAYTPFYYLAIYAQREVGISQSMSYNTISILGVGMAVGRPFVGF